MLKKTGLVLEGGGMRGVYTAGVHEYLLEQEIYYPYVIGVSAGASNSCNYVARQKGRGKRVNLKYLDDWRYMGLRSLIFKGSYFGLDFLFGDIPERIDPFDYDSFYSTPGTFKIGATNCLTGKTDYFEKHETKSLLHIKASCSLPLLSPVVMIEGRPYLDGGIGSPIPVQKALDDGCEHVVVVLTQPEGYRKEPLSARARFLYRAAYGKYPELVNTLEARHQNYNDSLELVAELERCGKATVIRPDGTLKLSRFEKNIAVLSELFEHGRRDAALKLTQKKV